MTELFDRESFIEDVLWSMDVPRSPPTYVHQQGIGPYDPDFFDLEHADRQRLEAKAVIELRAMTDDDLRGLKDELGYFVDWGTKFELFGPSPWYAGGFGVEGYVPDYDHWARMDYWTLDEAVCLSVGVKPKALASELRFRNPTYPALKFLYDRKDLAERAAFYHPVKHRQFSPRDFVTWARSKKLDLPASLISAVGIDDAPSRPAMLNTVDKRQYDSAIKVILGLLATNYAYRDGSLDREAKKDVSFGLDELGLSMDDKTVKSVLQIATGSRKEFVAKQLKKDEKDI